MDARKKELADELVGFAAARNYGGGLSRVDEVAATIAAAYADVAPVGATALSTLKRIACGGDAEVAVNTACARGYSVSDIALVLHEAYGVSVQRIAEAMYDRGYAHGLASAAGYGIDVEAYFASRRTATEKDPLSFNL